MTCLLCISFDLTVLANIFGTLVKHKWLQFKLVKCILDMRLEMNQDLSA